jgi:Mpv17 / PMP22 family
MGSAFPTVAVSHRRPLLSCAKRDAADVSRISRDLPKVAAVPKAPKPSIVSDSVAIPLSPQVAGGGGGDYGSVSNGGGGGGSEDGRAGDGAEPGWRLWLWPGVLARRYMQLLERAPLLTKVWTSAMLGMVSDVLAQKLESRGSTNGAGVNWRRAGALAVVGAVLTAPLFNWLYGVLERALPLDTVGGARARNLALQLFVDQGLAAPAWLLCFFPLFEVAESGSFDVEKISRTLRRDYLPSLKLTWMIFPVCQLLSFALLPSNLRVLVLNFVDLGYTAGLSMLKHA